MGGSANYDLGIIRDVLFVPNGIDTAYEEKNYVLTGSPGEGNDWHHIVEQSQINRSVFSAQQINDPSNLIAVDHATHMKITGYYTFRFTNGFSVRDWLAQHFISHLKIRQRPSLAKSGRCIFLGAASLLKDWN